MTTQGTILIVDDEPINLDLLEAELTRADFEVERARDGAQALAIVRRSRPLVIVTDILMPHMDGYQLCREIKSDPDLATIPVIFYSGTYTDPEDQDFAIEIGAVRFVSKPADPRVFMDVLYDVLAQQDAGKLSLPATIPPDETTFLSTYNSRLITKLEKKINDLDHSRTLLEHQVNRAREAEQIIRRHAYIDRLTGLPTRLSLLESIESDSLLTTDGYGLLHIEVDSFREIDYAIGHNKGNLLLRALAERVSEIAEGPVSSSALPNRPVWSDLWDAGSSNRSSVSRDCSPKPAMTWR